MRKMELFYDALIKYRNENKGRIAKKCDEVDEKDIIEQEINTLKINM